MKIIELHGAQDEAVIHEAWRRRLARFLCHGSRVLARWADQVARVRQHARGRPELEFYAEAGAPEGALYVDGRLIGKLTVIIRL